MAGTYRLVEEQPANFVNARTTAGIVLPSGQTRGVAGANEIRSINLAAGEHGIDYNFGENLSRITKRMFLASTQPAEVLCEELGVECVTVACTSGDDNITIEVRSDVIEVSGLGALRQIPIAETPVVRLDAGGGNDRVTLRGSNANELARLSPGTASLRRGLDYLNGNYGVLLLNVEDIVTDAAGGNDDLAVLFDTPLPDTLTAGSGTPSGSISAVLDNMEATVRALAFDRVRAITSAPPGEDTADIQALDFVLDLVGNWET
jgi:hypothetical protein